MLGDVISVGIWSEIPNKQSQLALPSVFCALSKNNPERSAKPHNTHPGRWLIGILFISVLSGW